MSKVLKLAIIFTLLFSVYHYSNAETTNLYNDVTNEEASNTSIDNSTNNTTDTNSSDDIDLLDDMNDSSTQTSTTSPTFNTNAAAQINTVSSISEANLGLNNILCILLIAIGILILLFAIAILIRLKKS